MPRLIKRYGSRKLYDTTESRYVGLEEVAAWIRDGQQVQVVDNRTGDDVTSAVLTQLISEEGRRGHGAFSTPFLHDLVRMGERAMERGEQALKAGETVVEAGIERAAGLAGGLARRATDMIRPAALPGGLGEMRDEVDRLRRRLEALESALTDLGPEADPSAGPPPLHGDGAPPDAPAAHRAV